VANNTIATPYDDNANPIASTKQGRTATGLGANYAAMVVDGIADPADAMTAAKLIAVHGELYNGATFDRHLGQNGIALVTSGGTTTAAVAVGTASDTPIKASPGRLCRVTITGLAGTTTGTTPIYDNASGHTGTILVVIPNNTAVGTVIDVQMPAAAGITVNGGANSPAMTISFV
jgi:hypothetical protein